MARLSQREGAWRYKTGRGPSLVSPGFEEFSLVSQNPTYLDRLYVTTISLPVAPPPFIPFWILIFDASTGQSNLPGPQKPQAGAIADFTSPPILVAGSVFVFEPPVKAYFMMEGQEQFQGEPFDTGILVIPSSSPVFFTEIGVPPGLSGFISTRARGTNPTELRERQRPRSPSIETPTVGRIIDGVR